MRVPVFIITFTALSSPAWGNPIVPPEPFGEGSTYPFIALSIEVLVLSLLLARRGFDPMRVFCAWIMVTAMTFFAFFPLLQLSTEKPLLLLPGEIGIVLIEALAILRISRLRFFRRAGSMRITYGTALGYSLTVNLISLLVSVPFVF